MSAEEASPALAPSKPAAKPLGAGAGATPATPKPSGTPKPTSSAPASPAPGSPSAPKAGGKGEKPARPATPPQVSKASKGEKGAKGPAGEGAGRSVRSSAGDDEPEGERAPKRATLKPLEREQLALRRAIDRRRPRFVRTASHRYVRIGRWGSWRKPRGQQSKQRRHYGYRPTIVSIGFRTPARVRGLTPTGFRPVIVHTPGELEGLEPTRHAAVIAHGVGVRKRLLLEEAARKKGIHVLNPILKEEVGT